MSRFLKVTTAAAKMVDGAVRTFSRQGAAATSAPPAALPQQYTEEIARFYPVVVIKTGGSDGDATTRASWTYTIKDLDGTELATAVAVVKTRPLGPMLYGDEIASPAYGQAFITAAGAWKLWDAGEAIKLTALSPLTDWRLDATTGEIQKKTRATLVSVTAAESGWTKIDDTTESKPSSCTAQAS
jgi:hypothetical protein